MNVILVKVLALAFAGGLGLPGHAEEVRLRGRSYEFVAESPYLEYDLSLRLGRTARNRKARELGIVFGFEDADNYYELRSVPHSLRLEVIQDGKSRTLARERFRGPQGQSETLIRRREHLLYVSVDGREFPPLFDATFGQGKVAVLSSGGAPLRVRCQPYAEIRFDDDFMRQESEQALSPWEGVSGKWVFHSVKERHSGTIPTYSVNPFSLGGAPEEGKTGPALATAGHAFWADYDYRVSLKSRGSVAGVVFGYQSADDHYRVVWDLTGLVREPRHIRLERVLPDGVEVLAEGSAVGASEQWYRFAIRLRGRRAQVYLDESLIFDVFEEQSIRGKVGLYSAGPEETAFDDVEVRDNTIFDFDRRAALEELATPGRGRWRVRTESEATFAGNVQPCAISPASSGLATFTFGAPGWADYVFSFDILPKGPGAFSPTVGSTSVGEVEFGAESTGALNGEEWRQIRVDLKEPQHALVYIEGTLERRLPFDAPLVGAPGIWLVGRAEIRNVRVTFHRLDDFELPTKNAIFVADPFMRHWSSPEGAWIPFGEGGRAYWHKGDSFGGFSLNLPVRPGLQFLFGLEQLIGAAPSPVKGYAAEISVDPGAKVARLALSRLGKPMASGSVPLYGLATLPQVRLFRDGKLIWAKFGPDDVLVYRDAEPIRGSAMAITAPGGLTVEDFRAMDVKRNHVRDETFERAFADWVRIGTWEVTNRFACFPRWSHLNGRSRSGAFLWNKFEYEGDLSIEFYAGERMRQLAEEQANILGSYPRNGDFNASFNCEGYRPDTGYTFLLSGWDRHWSEHWTRLLRAGQKVTETDRYLVPRTREGQTRAPIAWISEGRPVHGAWYFVKIRRRGNRLEYYYDNNLINGLSFEDPEPLTGRNLAIWTLDQSMMIARAKISYGKRTVPHRLLPLRKLKPVSTKPSAGLIVSSTTHPGLFSDFEENLCGWKTTHKDHGAALSLDPATKASGKHSLQLKNASLGGDFGAVVPVPPQLDASRIVDFSFDYRITPDVKVNLYLTIGGWNCFVRLTGDSYSDESVRCLGQFENVIADGRWHRTRFDLFRALHALPQQPPSTAISSMTFGNLHEGYLRAGFEGNYEGAVFHLDDFRIVSANHESAVPTVSWKFGSEETKAKAFEAVINARPDSWPEMQPITKQTDHALEGLKPGFHYLHIAGEPVEGAKTDVVHFPFYIQAPLVPRLVHPKKDGAWGGEPVVLEFGSAQGLHISLPHVALTVNGQLLERPQFAPSYDPKERKLALDLSRAPLVLPDEGRVQFSLSCSSTARETASTHEWALAMDYKRDKVPPPAVTLEGYPAVQDFEGAGPGAWAPASYTVASLDSSTAASGRKGLRVFKRLSVGSYAVTPTVSGTNLGKTPILSFDYKLGPKLLIDMIATSAADGQWRQIGFAGGDQSYPILAAATGIECDGRWRRAEINLHEMFRKRPFHPSMFQLNGLQFGDYGGASMGKAYHFNIDNFGFIPTGSAASGLALKWSATDPSGIKAYSYHWSAKATEDADQKPDATQPEFTFTKLPAGPLFFHIRAQDNAGNWGPTAHFKFHLDNESPKVARVSPNLPERFLRFSARDGASGIDVSKLVAHINGKSHAFGALHTEFDQVKGDLRWDWPADSGICSGPVTNGQVYNFELPPVSDYAGNVSQPIKWTWKVNYAQDKEPPYAPAVSVPAENVFSFDTFTSGLGSWRNWNGYRGSTVTRVFDPERKDYCVKVVDELTTGYGGVMINRGAYDAMKFPYLSFDYKIPAATKIHFMIHVNGVYRGVTITAASSYPNYTNIGTANIIADNKWHSTTINLLKLFKAALPGAKTYKITYLIIADYYSYYTPAGVPYYIDNFAISGRGVPTPTLQLKSSDPSGISQYRYLVASSPAPSTDKGKPVAPPKVTLPALDPGLHHLHFSARDGASNWGPAARLFYAVPWTLGKGKTAVKSALLMRAWHGAQSLWAKLKQQTVALDPDTYMVWRKPIGFASAGDWAVLPQSLPDWDLSKKGYRPNNVFLRWDGAITFPANGNWHLIAECNGLAHVGVDLNGDGKYAATELGEGRVVLKPAKLKTIAGIKAGQPYRFVALHHKAAVSGHIVRFSWSQAPAWAKLKDGQADTTQKLPRQPIPISAFSYTP